MSTNPPQPRPGAFESAIDRLIFAVEYPVKRALFNCRACGSCLLSQTHLICPMNCPKGLRNGPCGGTLDGRCEVFSDRPCVWMRIRGKDTPVDGDWPLRAPVDPRLLNTPSYINLVTGADAATRIPISIPPLPPPGGKPLSRLAATLAAGETAITVEVRSPTTAKGLGKVSRESEKLAPLVDAFNTTSHAGGHRGLSSLETARVVMAAGGEAVLQICGRDVGPAEYLDELVAGAENGLRNLLCLTGDWPAEAPPPLKAAEARKRFFRMDSSQMLLEAASLSATGTSQFGTLGPRAAPRFFLGAAVNPFSDPVEAVIGRTAQKAACGASFLQTQVVFDPERFNRWQATVAADRRTSHLFILPSIPLLGRLDLLAAVKRIPGIWLPPAVETRLREGRSFEQGALEFACELMSELSAAGGIHGFHLIPFGAPVELILEAVAFARSLNTRSPL